jgi:site-specific DNA-cytosine methylase
MATIKVLGVCAGNGAILWPFRKYLLGNIEPRSAFKTPKDEQWKANYDQPLFRDLNADELVGVRPTLIIGHPDCGHSSVLAYSRGKKFSDPKVNKSLNMFIEAVTLFRPYMFVMENLPALLKTYPDIKDKFPGYHFITYNGSVSKWGNSQISRKRLVLIGIYKKWSRFQVASSAFKLPNKKKLKLRTFKELVESLGSLNNDLCHSRLSYETKIAMFGGCKMTIGDIKKGWQSNPEAKRWKTGETKMINAPGVYRNLPEDYPLTVRKGNREFNAEGDIMSPRERARIQGIPDEFKLVFYGGNPGYWINKGNITVTKCFPMEISTWVRKTLLQINI